MTAREKTCGDTERKPTCNVQFSLLFRNSTKRSTTPAVAMTSSIGGLGSGEYEQITYSNMFRKQF